MRSWYVCRAHQYLAGLDRAPAAGLLAGGAAGGGGEGAGHAAHAEAADAAHSGASDGAAAAASDRPVAPASSAARGVREDRRELSQVRANVRLALTQMAACYLHLGRYDRALESCEQAMALDAHNVKAMYVRG